MAVKIAHAMGAEVTVLSQSLRKRDDGLKLGADHYFATSDTTTFKQACLALGVSCSGFCDTRTRPPSAPAIRHAG
jgi:D-arabinose 1-dehydrogenase-like Zn-dependent alcohol dehydrogenase